MKRFSFLINHNKFNNVFIYLSIYLSSSASYNIIGSLDTFSSHTCLFIYLFIYFIYLWIKVSLLWYASLCAL